MKVDYGQQVLYNGRVHTVVDIAEFDTIIIVEDAKGKLHATDRQFVEELL